MNGEGFAMILVETIEHFGADGRWSLPESRGPVIRRRRAESIRTVTQGGLVVVTLVTPAHPDFAVPVL